MILKEDAMSIHYTKEFRTRVAKEACRPENEGLEHIIAKKYGVRPWTVAKWAQLYQQYGEDGLSKGKLTADRKSNRERQLEKENAALREEIEILKKAAAFLAKVGRE